MISFDIILESRALFSISVTCSYYLRVYAHSESLIAVVIVMGCIQSSEEATSTFPLSEGSEILIDCTQSTEQVTSTFPLSEGREILIDGTQSTEQLTSTFPSSEEREKFKKYIRYIGELHDKSYDCKRIGRGSPAACSLTSTITHVKDELNKIEVETDYPGQFFSTRLSGQLNSFKEV